MLEHRQVLEGKPEPPEPAGCVGDGLLRALPRRSRRHDESRTPSGAFGEHAVLLFVAGLEFVAADEREQPGRRRHVGNVVPCQNMAVYA